MKNNTIELIARAVVVYEDAVLLCKPTEADYFYFPGGHVEFDEDIVSALIREIKEEVNVAVENTRFIGVLENKFSQDSEEKHEVNIVFDVRLTSPDIQNMEDHLESMWVPLVEFKEARVLPISLKEKVVQWMEDKQMFFGSEKDDIKLA